MMSIEVLESDPNVWSDQSFFNVDYNQTQHSCGITSKSGSGEPEWCVEDVEELWDSFGLDFDNEPSLALEVMNNEVEFQTKQYELDSSYLNASTFLSPISISPSSPTSPLTPFSPELTDDNFEHQLHSSNISEKSDESFNEDLDNTSALELLEQILSANSSDNEDSQQELYAINADQYFTEAVDESPFQTIPDIESESTVTEITTSNESHKRPKRQVKRKTISDTDSEPRETKRKKVSKVSVNKKERKKDQNRSAANRYRVKKRVEQESIDVLQSEQMKINEKLRAQLEKLQMEFKVVYPLATMAFANNHQKNLILQMLNIRVMKDNLLDKSLD